MSGAFFSVCYSFLRLCWDIQCKESERQAFVSTLDLVDPGELSDMGHLNQCTLFIIHINLLASHVIDKAGFKNLPKAVRAEAVTKCIIASKSC